MQAIDSTEEKSNMSGVSSQSGLYEARHTSSIAANETVKVETAVAGLHYLCAVTGATVYLFDLSGQQTHEFSLESPIDEVALSEDETVLVAGDREGVLHFVSSVTKQLLFSQPIKKQNSNDTTVVFKSIHFTKTTTEGVHDLMVLLSSGEVILIQELKLPNIKDVDASLQHDVESMNQFPADVYFDLSTVHNEWASSILPLRTHCNDAIPSLISCGCGGSAVSVWQRATAGDRYELHDSLSYMFQGSGVVQCEVTTDENFLLTLNDSDSLSVWLLSSLIMINIWTGESVKDFSLYQTTCGTANQWSSGTLHQNAQCSNRLCLITENDDKKREMKIVTVPGLDVIYSMSVSPATVLFHGALSEDSLYFISPTPPSSSEDEESESEENNSFQLMHLTQALPENRLATLLAQQKFEEAETFAHEYNLDSKLVYRNKAEVLNHLLVASSSASETQATMSSLLQCMDEIQAVEFIVNLVLQSLYPTLDIALQMLHYAKNKVKRVGSSTKEDGLAAMRIKIFSALNSLTTFQMIYGGEDFSPRAWHMFLEQSILAKLKYYLQLGDLHKASCVWNRHLGELTVELDSNNLLPMIQSIPESLPSLHLATWLSQNVVPFILQHTPGALGCFVQWVEQRIRLLELTEKDEWPENGIHFAVSVMKSITSFNNPAIKMAILPHTLHLANLSGDEQLPVSSLKSLQQKLKDLSYLHSSLQCYVSLSEHEKESADSVVYHLLDKVIAVELVATTIKSKVAPYVEKFQLNLDSVLLDYIKLFLSKAPPHSTGLTDSPHEAKTIALIQAIQDKELYVMGCVELLKHVHASWSEAVEELVQKCLHVDHPAISVLEKQYHLLQLKKLLRSYGVRDFNFSDMSKGWFCIRRIIISDEPSALEDALKVAEMYQLGVTEVYKHYIMRLGLQNKIEIAGSVLQSLPIPDEIEVAQKLFSLASTKLAMPFSPELDDPDHFKSVARIALLCLKTLQRCLRDGYQCSLCEEWQSFEEVIDLYKRLLALQVEYSLFITVNDLADETKCQRMFNERLTECASSPGAQTSKSHRDVIRFCCLLGYQEETVLEAMVGFYIQCDMMDRAVDICWTLIKHSPTGKTATLILSVIQEIWMKLESSSTSTAISKHLLLTLKTLSAQTTAICDSSTLLCAVETYSLSSLLLLLHTQCGEDGGEGLSPSMQEEATSYFDHWSWSPRFREDGLVLDPTSVMSVAVKYAMERISYLYMYELTHHNDGSVYSSLLPKQVTCVGDVQPLLSVSSQLGQTLRDNGHSQLTLHCTVQSLAQYCQQLAIISTTEDQMTSSLLPILQQAKQTVSSLVTSLIAKVLISRRLDHGYALALLLLVPSEVAVKKLQSIRPRNISNYSKVIALCKLGNDYSLLTGVVELKELSSAMLKSAEWGKRLSKYRVSFTEAFRGGMEEKKRVANVLFRNKHIEIDLILQYCSELLERKSQSVLLAYLRVLLTEWEQDSGYQERANAVIRLITNKSAMYDILPKLVMEKINPYAYDRLTFILQELIATESATQVKVEQGLKLLDCLKHYTRVAPPTDYERKCFTTYYNPLKVNSDLSEVSLPDSASLHLPFHPLMYGNPMEILGPELSSATVGKLVPIAEILKLPSDDFHLTCIKNIVENDCRTAAGGGATTKVRFTDVSHLLVKIQDFNLALNISKWLAKQLQNDEDCTESLKAALAIAMRWKQMARTEAERRSAEEKVVMFSKLLKITQTDQLLKQYHLDQSDYLELSVQGALLIITLYTDLPVSKGRPIPPIHKIATEIAQIHSIKLDKIRQKLAEKWLLAIGSAKKDMDVTQMSMLEDPTEEETEEETEDDLKMKRLMYLLNVPEKLEEYSLVLLSWAKRTMTPSVTCLSRVKALQVLFAISPPSLIETISGTQISDIKTFMQTTLFVSELEALHMSTTMSAFQNCNKEGLVRSLWRNHAEEPRALRLISELCMHYHITDGGLWTRLLQQLLSLGMLSYLRHVLMVILPKYQTILSSLPAVWQKTLLTSLEGASSEGETCTEVLEMLYRCPFPFELDVGAIVRGFCGVGALGHALAAVLVIPSQSERNQLVENVLKMLSGEQIVTLLEELSENSGIGGYIETVEELVYLYLNSSDKHEVLLGSAFFTPFVHYLIARKLMDGLLVKTLQLNKIQEAVQLVQMFNSKHNVSTTTLNGVDTLQEYLLDRNITDFDGILQLCSV